MSKFQLMETTISAVHAAMLAGEVTCRERVQAYLARIEAYENKGPAINAIIPVSYTHLRWTPAPRRWAPTAPRCLKP